MILIHNLSKVYGQNTVGLKISPCDSMKEKFMD